MARKARVSAAMLSLLEEGERHAWTLEELHVALHRGGAATDFSSVFRAAEKLAAAGFVRKLVLADGRVRFELVGDHHDHLYCTRCHGIEPIPCVIRRDEFLTLEKATGASILDHHLILSGICRTCRNAATKGRRRAAARASSRSRSR
jgi:Fur family transcriptional regulator, ferric uptake regulator